MENLIEINYDKGKLLGIETIAKENDRKICVMFVPGIPGDRVDFRRINVKLARILDRNGISSLRIDFWASGVSDGAYYEIVPEKIIEQIGIGVNYLKKRNYNKIVLIVFSEAAIYALNYVSANDDVDDIIMCNGVVKAAQFKQFSGIKKAIRKGNYLVLDSGYGVWLNIKIVRQKFDFILKDILKKHRIFAIYGTKDILTSESMKECENMGCIMNYVEGADHLFTKYIWEKELLCKIEDICKNKL